jgi:hypothetical protein
MGDDHFPRTHGWDQAYLDALRELGTGIVYGNDLLQGHRLPTQCAMTADIVRRWGYMALPTLRHMYVDNFWRDLGNAADCLRYLPEVVVEHGTRWPARRDGRRLPAGQRTRVYSADERRVRRIQSGPVRRRRGEGAGCAAVGEWRLFDEGTVPEYTQPEWYVGREHAPHLEQGGHRERLMVAATLRGSGRVRARCAPWWTSAQATAGCCRCSARVCGVGLRPDAGERRGGQGARRRCPARRRRGR